MSTIVKPVPQNNFPSNRIPSNRHEYLNTQIRRKLIKDSLELLATFKSVTAGRAPTRAEKHSMIYLGLPLATRTDNDRGSNNRVTK